MLQTRKKELKGIKGKGGMVKFVGNWNSRKLERKCFPPLVSYTGRNKGLCVCAGVLSTVVIRVYYVCLRGTIWEIGFPVLRTIFDEVMVLFAYCRVKRIKGLLLCFVIFQYSHSPT